MRALWYEFPQDESTFSIEDSFMIGDALLVKPVVESGVTNLNVYLPGKGKNYIFIEKQG